MSDEEGVGTDLGQQTPEPGLEQGQGAQPSFESGPAVQPVRFGPLSAAGEPGGQGHNLDLLLDVSIPVSVEVGRAELTIEEVLALVPGSIVTLDKKAEEPIDLRVNGKLVARGEVVLVDDTYGLRITQIVDRAGRLASLRK